MACSRGKANPDSVTKLRLFADSGGYCQKPGCAEPLFIDLASNCIHIAEIAHIIAAGDEGPRADARTLGAQRGHYDNLILLCPTCHTTIDKAPDQFPDSLVTRWKRDHKQRIQHMFGAASYADRRLLRSRIESILVENRSVFDQYGPHLESMLDPESASAALWKRKVLTSILPNNRRLLAILDANRHLLTDRERAVLEEFRQHVDDLSARHLDIEYAGGGRAYPVGMNVIAQDGA
jgi:hypothetical protein